MSLNGIGITRVNIISAIKEIDRYRYDIPPRRNSKRYDLLFEGKRYPPKYVISIAYKYATGEELMPYEFNGGYETNSFLESKGFQIVEKR